MYPTEIFLSTLDDLDQRLSHLNPTSSAKRPERYDLVMVAHLLRKLLIDGGSLVSIVNREHRIRLRFPVAGWPFLRASGVPGTTVQFNRRGLQADIPRIPKESLPPELAALLIERQLPLEALLREPVLVWNETPLSVKGLITYVANIGGGVHVGGDPTGPVEEALHELGDRLRIDGFPLALACLWDVAEVVRRGLEPLRAAIAPSDSADA